MTSPPPLRPTHDQPASVYLGELSEGSQRTMRQALVTMAAIRTGTAGEVTIEDFAWQEVDRDTVARLRRELAERYAPTTANKMLAALRGVLRVCRDQGRMTERAFQEATAFERVRDFREKESRVLSGDELARLYAACAAEATAAGRRDAALVTLYLVAGLRREEATALLVGDVDVEAGVLRIDSPVAERRREVPLGPTECAHFARWIEARGTAAGPLLLPVDRGGTIRIRRLTAQAVYGIVARVAQRAGVTPVTPRDLRRTCLIRLIRAGLDAEALRQRVGHLSWLNSTAYEALYREAGAEAALPIPGPATG